MPLCAPRLRCWNKVRVVVMEEAPPSAQSENCPFTDGGHRLVHDDIDDFRALLSDLTDAEMERLSNVPYTEEDH